MSHLWDIIQAHLDEYGVREAALARRMETSAQTLNSWKNRGLKQLPERWLLEAVARETRTPYDEVLKAVLVDIAYLGAPDGRDPAPTNPAGSAPANPRQRYDLASRSDAGDPEHAPDTTTGEESQDPGSDEPA